MPRSGKRATAGPRKPSSGFNLRKHGRSVARAISRSVQQSLSQLSASRVGSLPVPTMGGRQFWSDRLVFGGWRIQENVLTGHSRLLDARDILAHLGDVASVTFVTYSLGALVARKALALGDRPDVTYAIVAGGTGTPKGFNRLLAVDNDGCVTVAETRIGLTTT